MFHTLSAVSLRSRASGLHDVSPRKPGVHPSVWLTSGVGLVSFLICRPSVVSTRLTMFSAGRSSLLLLVWLLHGGVLRAETQTPSPAPSKSLFFFFFHVCVLFCPPESSQEAVTWQQQNGFSLVICTEIIISARDHGVCNYLWYRKQTLTCFFFLL